MDSVSCFSLGKSPTWLAPMSEKTRSSSGNFVGELNVELCPQGTLAERLRAAGQVFPRFTPHRRWDQAGKDVRHAPSRVKYLLEEALHGDFGLGRHLKEIRTETSYSAKHRAT